MVQRHGNCMVISPGCMQDVWAPPIRVGPNSVWHIRTAINHVAEWCHEFTWPFVLDHCMQLLKQLTVNHLHSLSIYNLKSRSRGPSMTSDPVWTNLPLGMPSVRFTAMVLLWHTDFIGLFEVLHSCHRISSVLTVHLHPTNLWL